jgi:hypothetical protein
MIMDLFVRFLFFLKNSCVLKRERPTSDLLTSFAPRLAGSRLRLGAYNKDYEENPCRILPKFLTPFGTSHNPNVKINWRQKLLFRELVRFTNDLYIALIILIL